MWQLKFFIQVVMNKEEEKLRDRLVEGMIAHLIVDVYAREGVRCWSLTQHHDSKARFRISPDNDVYACDQCYQYDQEDIDVADVVN